MNAREKLDEFAEINGLKRNQLIGWSIAADFAEWYVEQKALHGHNVMTRNEELIEPDVIYSLTDEDKLCLVKKLREETGLGMMDCKRALNSSNWKIDGAKSWLIQFRKKSGIMFD